MPTGIRFRKIKSANVGPHPLIFFRCQGRARLVAVLFVHTLHFVFRSPLGSLWRTSSWNIGEGQNRARKEGQGPRVAFCSVLEVARIVPLHCKAIICILGAMETLESLSPSTSSGLTLVALTLSYAGDTLIQVFRSVSIAIHERSRPSSEPHQLELVIIRINPATTLPSGQTLPARSVEPPRASSAFISCHHF